MNQLIQEFEGFRECAYKCPAGVWTIGFGSTKYEDGSKVKEGDTITKEKAEALLTDYLIKTVNPIFKKIPYELAQEQKDALASLIYNVGSSAFLRSRLFTAICNKDIDVIFRNWDWIKCGGKVIKGLACRRAKELSLFLSKM